MKDSTDQVKAKRGLFARIIDKLDKQMQEKAKSKSCCNAEDKSGKKSCCSL